MPASEVQAHAEVSPSVIAQAIEMRDDLAEELRLIREVVQFTKEIGNG